MHASILVIGGTRFFGIPMVEKLIASGYKVTIATRGLTKDSFGDAVRRLKLDLLDRDSVIRALRGKKFDAVIDKMGYCSNEMRLILETVACNRFIHMSTAGVYSLDHFNIKEEEFDPNKGNLIWCDRRELSYDDVKRNAERALAQVYKDVPSTSVRVPFVAGETDYTGRFRFYIEHILRGEPMCVENLNSRFCFAYYKDVANFLVHLVESDYCGAINGCSDGVHSVAELISYVEGKTHKTAILSEDGDAAPYNGTSDNSLNTERAKRIGFDFRHIDEWFYRLADHFIELEGN